LLLRSQVPVRAVDVPGTNGHLSLSGYLDSQAVVDTGGGPRQRPQAALDLQLDTRTPNWLSTHVELRGQVGGPFEGGNAGVFNLVHAFQNLSPSLELGQMFVDVRLPDADLRLGLQRDAWGKLDGIPPTDVVIPRDFHDPLVREFEESKVAVPTLEGSYYPPDFERLGLSQLRVSLAYLPVAVPPRLPLVDERWFPPTTNLPGVVISPELQMELGLDFGGPLTIPVQLTTANHRPPFTFDAGAIAARVSGNWRSIDWDIYHYSGAETAPNAKLSAEIRGNVLDPKSIVAKATLQQTNAVIHMTGVDAGMALGGATIRSEAAFLLGRHYLRPASDVVSDLLSNTDALRTIVADLAANGRAAVPLGDLFAAQNAIEWGVGVDYLINGFLPLLQLNQIIILDPAPRLLIADPETQLTFVLRRSFWQDRVELEFRSFYALERGSWFVLPRLSYMLVENLQVRISYLAVGGSSQSLIGQFGSNDELIFQIRYSF